MLLFDLVHWCGTAEYVQIVDLFLAGVGVLAAPRALAALAVLNWRFNWDFHGE